MNIGYLRCGHRVEPLGLDQTHPRLTWELTNPSPDGAFQRGWRIVVASSRKNALAGMGDLWDSGWVESSELCAIYAGSPLASRSECFWQVQCRDESGAEITSDVASWTMGLLQRDDWSAHWIGLDTAPEFPPDPFQQARWIWDGAETPGERIFEKTFVLEEDCDGTLWGLADDAAEVEINGRPIAQLTRAQANFNLFPLPLPIQVRGLKAGENRIVVRATKLHDRDPHGGVILRLHAGGREVIEQTRKTGVEFVATTNRRQDGGISVVTDASWRCSDGTQPVVELGSFGVPPWHLQSTMEYPNLPARYVRREFKVESPIRRAVLYFSGLGLSEAVINGHRVGHEELSPHVTDYAKTVFYRTFDVTDLLREGDNAIGCILGNGRFFAPRVRVPVTMESYGCPKLLLQLEITHADGSSERIISNGDWKVSTDGPIGWNNEFDGESYDARRDDPAWGQTGFDDSAWTAAGGVAGARGKLIAQPNDPIRRGEYFPPVESWTTKYGTRIFDFGVNLVGWCRATFKGREGNVVRLQFAEEIENRDALSLENLRSAQCADTITLREGTTGFEPKFTYHGFRYVELRGDCDEVELMACFVHDEVPETGSFSCSNELVNQIVEAAARGIRGNYRSMPTDCPQRDERMGWLGDRAGGAPGEMFLFDVAGVYRKWLGDIRDSQSPSGSLSDIAPAFWGMMTNDNVTWPSCVSFIPHWLQRHYGDPGVVAENFPAIEAWVENMCRYLDGGLLGRDIYGDWCVPPESPHLIHSERADRKTSPVILASSYLAKNLEIAATFARQLGHTQLAETWTKRREEIAAALAKAFLDDATGRYDNGSQTAALLPLAFDLVPESRRAQVFEFLVSRLTESGTPSLGTGLVGGQWLLRTLTAHGRADLATALVTRDEYPSWGYMIRQGATTIWELWNGNTADPFMNSRNHVMLLGDLLTWLFEDVAGIQPRSPGFATVGLRPHFVFDSVECSHRTVQGPIRSGWHIENGATRWSVELPPGVDAVAELPTACAGTLEVNGRPPDLEHFESEEGPLVRLALAPGPHVLTFQNTK